MRNLVVHDYSTKVSGFPDDIVKLDHPIMDVYTTVRMDNENEIIIQISQAPSKTDEEVSMLSIFLVRYNDTKIDTEPMHFRSVSEFGIDISNEYANNNVVIFTIRAISVGVPIRTPSNEDLDTLPIYEITSPLFWN